jgi:dTDP-4-amino-4,6-dideoxygalactose transaminase
VTDDISGRLIRLPFYTHTTNDEVRTVADVVVETLTSL